VPLYRSEAAVSAKPPRPLMVGIASDADATAHLREQDRIVRAAPGL
jgi:hypothetical protein